MCSPAFIAQILHASLFDLCSALTSLLRLGCSRIGFNLAGVASLACKILSAVLDLTYALSECFICNPKHHLAFYQDTDPSLYVVRSIVV